jgi:hypothetical protein
MTEGQQEPGRIDLRAIDEPDLADRGDRIIAEAIARSAPFFQTPRPDLFAALREHERLLLGIAAVVLVVATGGIVLTRDAAAVRNTPEVLLAEWSRSNHVPTNGELLSAFQGYGR